MRSTHIGHSTRLIDPLSDVYWCSRWTSGSANKLTNVGAVCTCHGVEGVVQVMTSGQRDSGRCCTVVTWNAEHSHWPQHPSDRPTERRVLVQ
jgi:ribosomal 30S subunit maturation factor RimM